MQDTNNYIYAGSFEQNAINIYNPANGSVSTYVRDPRIGWTDSMWISNEKYLYFIEYADLITLKCRELLLTLSQESALAHSKLLPRHRPQSEALRAVQGADS